MRQAIYKAGETNIQTTVTNGYADFTGYKTADGVNLKADEYIKMLGPEYKIIPLDEAVDHIHRAQDAKHINGWKEITEDEYDEMLNVLPPEKWLTVNGVNIFRMCEYLTGNITAHYAQLNGRYFVADRRTTDKYEDLAAQVAEMAA